MENLPFITPEIPGIGGKIKENYSDFSVEEIPLYEPSGEGDHIYVKILREGFNTRDIQKELANKFNLKPKDIGIAGLKDKNAKVIQTFSLDLPNEDIVTVKDQINELGFEILSVKRHKNKLRKGHLLGNKFEILVSDTEKESYNKAIKIADILEKTGVPNYYGEQRFGGENIEKAREILEGKYVKNRWLRNFLLSSYQSHLFNKWLSERIQKSNFDKLLQGDVAKKTDTGGLFVVENLEKEQKRFNEKEIIYTGPIFGKKMKWPEGEPKKQEEKILNDSKLNDDVFRKFKLDGSRRPAIIFLDNIKIEEKEDGILFKFSLPKGSYATTVLREFMKNY